MHRTISVLLPQPRDPPSGFKRRLAEARKIIERAGSKPRKGKSAGPKIKALHLVLLGFGACSDNGSVIPRPSGMRVSWACGFILGVQAAPALYPRFAVVHFVGEN